MEKKIPIQIKLPAGETERVAVAKRNGIIFKYSDGRWLVPSDLRAYTESTSSGRKNIEKGTPREMVLKIMGEPNFTLSGLHGDGYVLEDGSTVFATRQSFFACFSRLSLSP